MVRENTIKLSNEEKNMLDAVRDREPGMDEAPYGVVVQFLFEKYNS